MAPVRRHHRARFGTVQAVPMRLREQVVGALNLFGADPGSFGHGDLRIGQALADIAPVGLLQERNVRRREAMAEQPQAALNTRVVIEQARGKLAERLGVDVTMPSGSCASMPGTLTSGSRHRPPAHQQPLHRHIPAPDC
jgi:hypothetical protein